MQTTPRSVVRLPERARPGIGADVERECRMASATETAGLLLLTPEGDGMATGPGARARFAPDACEWDADEIARTIDTARHLGAPILGRWHKHTSSIILASDTDRESARAFLEATGLPEMLDLIVACDEHDRPIGWALYVCTPEEYRRAELVWK